MRGRRHHFVNWNPHICQRGHVNLIKGKYIEVKSGIEEVDIAKEAHVL